MSFFFGFVPAGMRFEQCFCGVFLHEIFMGLSWGAIERKVFVCFFRLLEKKLAFLSYLLKCRDATQGRTADLSSHSQTWSSDHRKPIGIKMDAEEKGEWT